MKVIITGSTGFIGSNVIEELQNRYHVTAPTRNELDLLDASTVRNYLRNKNFDVIIHLANPTTNNPIDKCEEIFERSLRVFTTLAHCNELYGKMLYIGSGAEYGKHRELIKTKEKEFGDILPRDTYGLSRYIMNELAGKCKNIFNLRVFGCYGCRDADYKLIPHIMNCISSNKPVELRQNTLFDFLYVKDIIPVLIHFIENEPKHKAYNLCSGSSILIGDIAKEVCKQMNAEQLIVFRKSGYGLEYTGNNERLCSEIQNWHPCSISYGIKEIIKNENRKI